MGIAYEDVFNLDELFIETVIGALNKYFVNDKYDTSFIEVRKNGVVYRVSADDLIAWLRTKHGIFYYPGMEAKYAKTERIPPFSERMMDEGALNSLKKLHKRVTGEEPEVDSHTLIADSISHAVSVKDAQIEELKTHRASVIKSEDDKYHALRDAVDNEIWEVNNNRWNDLRDISKALGYDFGMNGHIDDFAKEVKARATYIKSEHDTTQTKLDTIEKRLEELLNDIKEEVP